MGCNKDTKKCNIKKGELLPDCCKKNILEILIILNKVFKEHNILYWVDYGTLLGATRNNSIIPYDDDGDIGILRQDLEKLLCLSDEFRLLGYHLVTWFYPDFIRLDFSRINELHVDIFIWDFKRMQFKKMWESQNQTKELVCLYRNNYIVGKDEKKGQHFPVSMLFPLSKLKIQECAFWGPKEPDKFCEFRYGQDWRTEKCE